MYQSGMGFVPDWSPQDGTATVAILAQNPGADEEAGRRITGYVGARDPLYESVSPRPLIGASGYLLRTRFLPLAGLREDQVSYHNVLKCRWQQSNALPEGAVYERAVEHCTAHHLQFSAAIRLIVAQGRAAWHYLTGDETKAITDWRGFLVPYAFRGILFHAYATLHMADLLRDPVARFIARFDWKRLRRVIDGTWPLPVPPSVVASPATRSDFIRVLDEALEQPEIMVDTEYVVEKQLLTHVGAAWKVGETIHGFQLEWLRGQATPTERAIFMRYWPQLCEKVTMGFWHAKADLPILEANLHAIPVKIEDPMYAHACLWPDMDHDLGFVASLYGKYNKLKHLAGEDILQYHWGDCIELVWIWEQLKEELQHDPLTARKYREQCLPLIPILLRAESTGIRVNREGILQALPDYERAMGDADWAGQSYAGRPINLGSSTQVITQLGLDGITVRSVDKDIIAAKRAKYLEVDAEWEQEHGMTLDYVMGRIEQGAHPILETRVMYAKNAKVIDDFLTPLKDLTRYYPHVNIHTQAGGRHSTTRLGTVPPDLLKQVILPDPGTVWIGWDWDAQEPRITLGESGSQVLEAAFLRGEDIHTTFVCLLYGWPFPTNRRNPHTSVEDAHWRQEHNWKGKDDVRRRFAKETRYECVPLHTQILTRGGWKTHDQVTIGEEVMTYNEQKRMKEWGRLEAITYRKEEVFEVKNKWFAVQATANHQWYVNQRKWNGKSWCRPYMTYNKLTTAELNRASNLILNAPLYEDHGLCTNLDQPKYDGTDWVREVCRMSYKERAAFIRGFALADGAYNKRGVWIIDQKDGKLWDAILTAAFIQHSGFIATCLPKSRGNVKRLQMSQRQHVTMQRMEKVSMGVQSVWCPTTNNGSWVMRQGDRIAITGNCTYLGDGSTAARKAVRMGIDPVVAKRAAQTLIQSDPDLAAFHQRVRDEVSQTKMIHSWDGGRRVFFWVDTPGQQEDMYKQAVNGYMQIGGAGVYNLTLVEISRTVPGATFVYGRHDAQYWATAVHSWRQVVPDLKRIATQARNIRGRMIEFPATFKVIFEDGHIEEIP